MLPATRPPIVRSILETRCPKCRLGEIFRDSIFKIYRLRLPRMNERCPVCDFKFMREPGYFLGAMYISYGLGLLIIIVIGTVLWLATKWWITTVTIWAVIAFLPLAPGISMFARVLWLYLDWAIDPE